MIVELGHFALILALPVTLLAGVITLYGAHRRDARLMAVGGAGGDRPVRAGGIRLRLPDHRVRDQRLLGGTGRQPLQSRTARRLPDRRDLGLARGFDAAVGADAHRLERGGGHALVVAAGHAARPRAGHPGPRGLRFPAVPAVHLQSLRAPAARGGRRARPESAAAGPGHGVPSAACSTWATSASRSPSRSRWPACSKVDSTRPGRDGRARGPRSPGPSSRWASRSDRSGPTTSSAGAAGGSGIRSRTPRSCRGWWAPR